LMGDDPETAIRHCEEALAAATARDAGDLLVPFVVTGVRGYLAAGRPEAAQRWLERTAVATASHAPIASAALAHGRGLALLAGGSVGAARDSLEAAVSMWDSRGRTWEGLWARLDLAGALLRSKGYVEAARRIAQVREAAERMGSVPLLRRAEELERLARGRGAEQEAWYPLTVREFEVARQIAAGLTNAEIAAELFVAPKTVSAHVEHILAKLGANRRTEIASWVSSIAQPVA
jgi:DNA-binding CsgD family transcriptional regulator